MANRHFQSTEAGTLKAALPSAVNPMGCWDWWGYTGPDYRWRDGAQMKLLADWMRSLAGLEG